MRAVTVLMAAMILAVGCDSQRPAVAAPAAPAAPAATQASWAPDALEELLAPIALYPDALLGQILAASVNAQEVLDGGNWLLENQTLKDTALDEAAKKVGFGPAMRALFPFPSVIDMMCQQIEWTRKLGAAFTSDQKAVLDAVQRLRAQASAAGHLVSTPQQTVEKKTEGDKVIVEVKPADPKVVYVPQYDPQVVYVQSPPATTTTTTTSESTVSPDAAVAGGLLAFGVGVILGNAMDDDDYCYPHWGTGMMYYGPRPFYPPAYVYRPVYGNGLHPAHHYNNINVKRNVIVNNDNYFNRFNGGRPQVNPQRNRESWQGQTSYAGARDTPRTDRGYGASSRDFDGQRGDDVRANTQSRDAAARNRASDSTRAGARSDMNARSDASARGSVDDRDSNTRAGSQAGRSVDDYAPLDSREGAQARRSIDDRAAADARANSQASPDYGRRSEVSQASGRDNALAGTPGRDGASFDRAASARGRASASGRSVGGARRR
jgi:hypothetical protein